MEPINVHEYEALAQARMEIGAWDYHQGGSDDEVTVRANRAAFERIWLRPRVLVDVSNCELATTVLGIPVSMPILVAPMALHGLAHEEAEVATARAAATAKTLTAVSTFSTHNLEDVADAATGPLWFQVYAYRNFKITEILIKRAEAAGYRALVLTVDTPRVGRRERDIRNNFGLASRVYAGNFVGLQVTTAEEPLSLETSTTLTWDILAHIRTLTTLPVLVKGVLTAEDAVLAVKYGAAGIIVSNHGGRQLDSVIPSILALPEVVDAVAGRCEVYVDGGIRRGTDVLKALALGARAVLVGRPILWGLAANGAEGVAHVLALLRAEFELAMMLAGCPTLASIDRSLIRFAIQ